MRRAYLSSTFEDLKGHRERVYHALRRLEYDVRAMEDYVATDQRPVKRCLSDVEACDTYIGIIAFRRGYEPEDDNPERCSITQLEYRRAMLREKTVLIFMLRDTAPWPPMFVDVDDKAVRVSAFRKELSNEHVVSFFDTAHELAELVISSVVSRPQSRRVRAELPLPTHAAISLRDAVPHDLPERPYPLLAPYEHPATFAGRDREIGELEARVREPRLVLCLHAASGAGKSSLLMAGLAPRLRQDGHPVSVERRPGEPGVATRVIADLLRVQQAFALPDQHPALPATFRAWIDHAHQHADRPPVLILDQFDDLLRLPKDHGRDAALARLGPLMAATARRMPGGGDYPCRWVLCYRHEFHGEVDEWLRDVLREARLAMWEGLEALPYDLSDPSRVHTWPIPLFGMPEPGEDAYRTARQVFLEAIRRPLGKRAGQDYGIRFIGNGGQRLAEAFARARARQLTAPLVPELQVVLGHFLELARVDDNGVRMVAIPRDLERLDREIDEALATHLQRSLENVFPLGRDPERARKGRAQALLALRELADDQGRRGKGRTRADLVASFGADGDHVLDTLASPRMRLVIQERRESDQALVCVLSHDRLAEVVSRLIDTQSAREGLDLDDRLVELRRFIAQRSDLYVHSLDDTALSLTAEQHDLISSASAALLTRDQHRRWWWDADDWFRLSARFAHPQDGIRALLELTRQPEVDWSRLAVRLRAANINPLVFWRGPWARQDLALSPGDLSPTDILDIVELTHPAFADNAEMVRAMSHAVEETLRRSSEFGERARAVREQLRSAMDTEHRDRAPRFRGDIWHLPDEESLGFVKIPGGEFIMGTNPGPDSPGTPDEQPAHVVALESFYIGRYPVTVSQFRAFVHTTGFESGDPECLTGLPEYPAVRVSWYEALAYCDWLTSRLIEQSETPAWLVALLRGGKRRAPWRVTLPSEAEWEKAARGGDARMYPWGDSIDPTCANYSETGRGRPNLVGEYARGVTAEGLFDMGGNVWEWTRSLWGPEPKRSWFTYPYVPADGREDRAAPGNIARVLRGGSFLHPAKYIRSANRHRHDPDGHSGTVGFRLVVSAVAS